LPPSKRGGRFVLGKDCDLHTQLTTPNAGLFYIRKKLIATDNSCPGQKKFAMEIASQPF
jgi:hypothetical protein